MRMINRLKVTIGLSALVIGLLFVSANAFAAESVYTNSGTGFQVIIEDRADLLTDAQETALYDVMIPLTEFGNIGFLSTDSNANSARYYAEDRSHDLFGRQTSQTVFLIDMDNRDIFIYSDGSNYRTLTNSKATIIADNIYTYASAENYYQCAYSAYEQMYRLLNGGRIAEPLRYISAALISILTAMLVCFIIINSYSKLKAPSINDILGPALKDCKVENVEAQFTGESKTYSPRSSGSSGGSSRGGGGGGHSGGGGGGHSGGGGGHHF
ncbi:MAG: TPM domain-containing protein [Lachnospiraceae bacterium]|nr:TPM domain-containing protein [Lachnospiraceae bacterium]